MPLIWLLNATYVPRNCYPSGGETFCILSDHRLFGLSSSHSTGHAAGGVALGLIKKGMNYFVSVSDTSLLVGIRAWIISTRLAPDDLLFPFSYCILTNRLKQAEQFLFLETSRYSLHFLQHDGDAHDLLCNVPLDDMKQWSHRAIQASFKRYLQSVKGLLASAALSSTARRRILRLSSHFEPVRNGWGGAVV